MDLSAYQPPGVYVEETTSSLVSVGGTTTSVVAIVGPSQGYRTATDVITLTGTAAVTLTHAGADVVSGFSVTSASGTAYVQTTDYVLTQTAGTNGTVVTIARASASTITDGQTVYVAYHYTDNSYYQPQVVTGYDDVQSLLGPAMDLNTNAVLSPLSLAAKFALDNGASTLVLVPTPGAGTTTVSDLNAAYSQLDTAYDVNIIVPLPVGITGTDATPGNVADVGSGLLNYITTSLNNGLLRVGIVGVDTGATVDPATLVAAYQSKRIMHAHPNRMTFYNGATNSTIEIGGMYLAAAYAGRFSGLTPQEPLTMKVIRGFSGIPATMASQMTTAKKNIWSNQGVAVTQITRQNTLVVRHGTSTDRTSTLTREFSLVRARDALVNLIQDTLDTSGLIGTYIDTDTTTRIQGVITGVLETAKALGVIVDYQGTSVRQRPGLPSVIDVKFQYVPAYPLNYIDVSFSVDTTTGSTSNLTA